jgi:hypothetical protein
MMLFVSSDLALKMPTPQVPLPSPMGQTMLSKPAPRKAKFLRTCFRIIFSTPQFFYFWTLF